MARACAAWLSGAGWWPTRAAEYAFTPPTTRPTTGTTMISNSTRRTRSSPIKPGCHPLSDRDRQVFGGLKPGGDVADVVLEDRQSRRVGLDLISRCLTDE